jgi:hypothetical protein
VEYTENNLSLPGELVHTKKSLGSKLKEKTSGLGLNIPQAEFSRVKLPTPHENDRSLSVRVEKLKKRLPSCQESFGEQAL